MFSDEPDAEPRGEAGDDGAEDLPSSVTTFPSAKVHDSGNSQPTSRKVPTRRIAAAESSPDVQRAVRAAALLHPDKKVPTIEATMPSPASISGRRIASHSEPEVVSVAEFERPMKPAHRGPSWR